MRTRIGLLAVVPVGPGEDGADTLDSILTYCTQDVAIVVVDDSRESSTAATLESLDPRVRCVPAVSSGARGGLFVNLAHALRTAFEWYEADVVMRIDTDALVIGPRPEDDARAVLDAHPQVGMLGAYRLGFDGGRRDFTDAAALIRREVGLRGIRSPARRKRLAGWLDVANRAGYQLGEHCLGGAVFQNGRALEAIRSAGDLNAPEFADSSIGEDHLFGLLTVAHGFTLRDFATGDHPMAVKWKGLPASPTELMERRKKVVHSTKYFGPMTREEIEQAFRVERSRYRGGHATA